MEGLLSTGPTPSSFIGTSSIGVVQVRYLLVDCTKTLAVNSVMVILVLHLLGHFMDCLESCHVPLAPPDRYLSLPIRLALVGSLVGGLNSERGGKASSSGRCRGRRVP